MRKRILVIVGTTGSGKTKLSLNLCKAFNGEVVNCDVMQMYKGLNIATAKPTEEQMKKVPHHLFSFLSSSETFGPREYREKALETIDSLLERKKLPIIVGGTFYYLQSLLFSSLLDEIPIKKKEEKVPSDFSYDCLKKVDPKSAEKLHPNDKRKIQRSLEIFYQYGISQSELIQMQEKLKLKSLKRFDALILYVDRDKEKLHQRLRKRVDLMVEKGIVEEAKEFLQNKYDDNLGLSQSMGFREFEDYLDGKESLEEAKERLFIVHRQYSKYQKKWIEKKIIGSGYDVVRVKGEEGVELSRKWLNGEEIRFEKNCPIDEETKNRFECDICNKVLFGERQWNSHLKSRKHKYFAKKQRIEATEEKASE
eukprot:snap_masked-scaffold_88-processed-gene-0.20-mRNA-1 protein AED:0.24 eAED:0.24 QI:0/0/0/1/1/1/2/0/365